MPTLKVRNLKNKETGEIELSDAVFGAEVKYHLLHEIVRMQRNRARAGSACTKERNAVSGGGRKPFRQKGTGRARQGSERAPNHVGGGTVFGPQPRSFDFSPPKQVRRGAMQSALSLFVKENRLIVLEDFELPEIKTRKLETILGKLGTNKAVLVDFEDNDKLRMSAGNLANYLYLPPAGLNVLDILRHDQIVMTKRAALDVQARLEKPVRPRRTEA
jgi:large subunit ribosomal protein L4